MSGHSESINNLVAGAVGGAIASVFVQPLDLIRTRMQQRTLTEGVKQMSMFEVGNNIIKSDGILGLWKGTSPTLYRIIPGAGLYFFILENMTSLFRNGSDQRISHMASLVCGSSSRALVTAIMVPVTVVKTRFEGLNHQYKSTPHALKMIYNQEGVRTLYSGLVPTILRDVPFSGIYYLCYEDLKIRLAFLNIGRTFANITAGFLAGVVATAITHPTDVIKTKLQLPIQNLTDNGKTLSKRPGLVQMFTIIKENEGIRGLYKGFLPRLIRRPLLTALTWAIYEEMKIMLSNTSKL